MTDDWKAVGTKVRARRKSLGLRQGDLSKLGGPSEALVRELESGRYDADMQDAMRAGLERALEWAAGSLAAMLAGGEPIARRDSDEHTKKHAGNMDGLLHEVDRSLDRFRATVADLVAAEADLDASMRHWARAELMRRRLDQIIASNPRYGTGFAPTPEEATEVIAAIPRPTPAEVGEVVAWSAMHDDREWTRHEMALIEAVFTDYPNAVQQGSSYADLEPFRDRVRRLGPLSTESGGTWVPVVHQGPDASNDLPSEHLDAAAKKEGVEGWSDFGDEA